MSTRRSSIDILFASLNELTGVEIDGGLSLAAMVIGLFCIVAPATMRAMQTANQIFAVAYFAFDSDPAPRCRAVLGAPYGAIDSAGIHP
jgi:hypothetical protein